jgi:anti-sigma B factor antagonist
MGETEPGERGDPADRVTGSAGTVVLDRDGAAAVLRVTGALDLALAPQLQQMVDRAARDEPVLIVIDLSDLDFLASAGMAVLVRAHRRQPAVVRLVASSRIILRPLELTRLTDELIIHPTLDDALAAG